MQRMSPERTLQDRQLLGVSESSRSYTPHLLHKVCHRSRIFMFPNTNHCPTRLGKEFVVPSVSCNIGFQFGVPPDRICFGGYSVFRATVPKTTVNKEGNSSSTKHHIWSSKETWNVYSEPEASTMQFFSQVTFGFSSLRLQLGHKLVYRWARRRWLVWVG